MDIRQYLLSRHAALHPNGDLEWSDASTLATDVAQRRPLVCWLPGMARVDFAGEDVRTFLQGQLTNDIFAIEDGQAQWQGYCQPQGRLLATFPLVRVDAQHFWGALPASIAAAIMKRLSMFVLRSKVKISAGDEAIVATLFGANPIDSLAKLSPEMAIASIPAAQFSPFWETLCANHQPAAAHAWSLACINAGIAEIDLGAQDLFVPQMVGWDRAGVNFKKGCYPGQEVVARAHYRGAVKRKPTILCGHGALPANGSEIMSAGEPIGNIVKAVATSEFTWKSLAAIHQDYRVAGMRLCDGMGECEMTLIND